MIYILLITLFILIIIRTHMIFTEINFKIDEEERQMTEEGL